MKSPFKDYISLVEDCFGSICDFFHKLSGIDIFRNIFGNYLGVEILISISLILEMLFVLFLPYERTWLPYIAGIVSTYRILTMGIAHINILLRNKGKASIGTQIYSRFRYLILTFFNFIEIILWGTIIILCLEGLNTQSSIFNQSFGSIKEILFHCFQLAMLNLTPQRMPVQLQAYLISFVVTLLGAEIILVVLSIILNIKPTDELLLSRALSKDDYWDWRAKIFHSSPWIQNSKLNNETMNILLKSKVQTVADIGCGTAMASISLALNGILVTGIDKSEEMLFIARKYSPLSIKFLPGDARDIPLPDCSFDAVLMRMLLHNITNWREAIKEAYRILKPNGILVVIEGFPPSDECWNFFTTILSQVHEREYFKENILTTALEEKGFKIVENNTVLIENFSVSSWLKSAVPNLKLQEILLRAHRNMSEKCKNAYRTNITEEEDVLLTVKFLLLTARKNLISFDKE